MESENKLISLNPIKGLGTVWFFEIPENFDQIDIQKRLETEITNFNNAYSRFDSNSTIYNLNSQKTLKNPSSELVFLLNLGKTYFSKTNGIFNFLLENTLVDLGYGKRQIEFSTDILPNPSYDIEISDSKIILKKGGVDLGGFGKGFLIDKLSAILADHFGLEDFVINGGGDIFSYSKNNIAREFYLQHPIDDKKYISKINLCNQSLAASSTFIRKWKSNNSSTINNHLIDPESKKPIPDCAVYIISDSAIKADIWATTISIAKKSQIQFLYETKEFEFLKITKSEKYSSKNFLQKTHPKG